MMTLMILVSSLILSTIVFMTNPIKMMFTIVSAALVNFYIMSECTGSSWLPMTFLLLFVGGILVMFTIVSALTPNEKSFPTMGLTMILVFLITLSWKGQLSSELQQVPLKMGAMIQSSNSVIVILLIMTCYFIAFTQIVKKKTFPLRSTVCHWMK